LEGLKTPVTHVTAIRLADENNEHLGFILLAGKGCPMAMHSYEGDCIFMPLPQNAALFNERPYLLLSAHKDAGKHRFAFTNAAGTESFRISGVLPQSIWLSRCAELGAHWGLCHEGKDEKLGVWYT